MDQFTSGVLSQLKWSRNVISKHLAEIDTDIAKIMGREYPPTEAEKTLAQYDFVEAIKVYRTRTNGDINLMWCKMIMEKAIGRV